MTIIARHISKNLARYLFFVLLVAVGIFLSVDFFEKIDDFMEAGLPMSRAFAFFVLRVPFVAAQVLPVAVLLSVLFVFGIMSRNNEITAFRAGGGSPVRLLVPAISLGVLAALGLLLFSESVVPHTARMANKIWLGEVKKELPKPGKESSDLWFSSRGLLGHVAHYVPASGTAFGVTLNFFDPRYRLIRRIDAESAEFDGKTWRLSRVLEQTFSPTGDTARSLGQRSVTLAVTPEDMKSAVRRPEESTYRDLSEHADRIEAEGYEAVRLRVDCAAKLAFPWVSLIMAVSAGGLAVSGGGRESRGMAANAVIGITLAFAYWAVHSLALSVGYAGYYSPAVAAWTANAIFGALAGFLLFRLRESL